MENIHDGPFFLLFMRNHDLHFIIGRSHFYSNGIIIKIYLLSFLFIWILIAVILH
jgi:hypothetical protein